MRNNTNLGALLAVIGILIGLWFFYLISDQYNLVITAKETANRFDEATSVRITYAVLGWLGVAATALWAVVVYGFLIKARWAWFWGAVAASVHLLVGFFPTVPAMDSQLPIPTVYVFMVAGVLWFGMLVIGGVPLHNIALTFFAGIAYVLTFMDGVAPISKYTTSHDNPFWNGMYVMSQQVAWWGAAAWAVFIFAVFKNKKWAVPVGLFGGFMSMLAGYPLGLNNAINEVHRFSLFLPAPIISTLLVLYLLLPSTRRRLESPDPTRAEVRTNDATPSLKTATAREGDESLSMAR